MDTFKDCSFAWAKLLLIEGRKRFPSLIVFLTKVRPIVTGFGGIKGIYLFLIFIFIRQYFIPPKVMALGQNEGVISSPFIESETIDELFLRSGIHRGASVILGPFWAAELAPFGNAPIKKTNSISLDKNWLNRLSNGTNLFFQVRDSIDWRAEQFFLSTSLNYRSNFFEWLALAQLGDSTYYPPRRWKGKIAADMLRGVWYHYSRPMKFIVGRDYLFWGEGLLFSRDAVPIDRVSFSFNTPTWNFHYFLGIKESPFPKKLKAPVLMSAHFFTKKVRSFYLGFAEVIAQGGKWEAIDPSLFLPFGQFYARQWVRKWGDYNILWSFASKVFLKKQLIGLELVIDDFPYHVSPKGEHPKIAFGLSYGRLISSFNMPAFYKIYLRGATRWTYGHRVPYLGWTHWGVPIGSPSGSDFLMLGGKEIIHARKDIDIIPAILFHIKGEGEIGEQEPEHFPKAYFLTGVVESKIRPSLAFKKYWGNGEMQAEIAPEFMFNRGHKKKKYDNYVSFSVTLSRFF